MTTPIRERLEHWRAFIDGTSSRRFMFHVNFPLPEWDAKLPPDTFLWPDKVKERIERRWADYQLMCHKTTLVEDDRVPYLNNATGTEIFAEAFGCRVQRPGNTMPFALPLVHTAAEADRIKVPSVSTSSLAYLFDIADELYRRGGPEALSKPVDVQSPMDIVALIWDKSELFPAMVDRPEAVHTLAAKVRLLMEAFFDEWFKRYGTCHVAHYPDYVMHSGITMSVDEVGSISPEMFCEFFRDELIGLSKRYGGLGIHCCADARHQWENFRDLPGLKVMNHLPGPTRNARDYILDSIRFYGNRFAHMPGVWQPSGAPETWPAQYPEGIRVIFEVPAEDVNKAKAIADQLQQQRAK